MTATQALLAFGLAAGLLTLTPGLDTALVLRTAATGGPRRAFAAAVGIGAGCMIWGLAAACGAGALLTASTLAYGVLQGAGAAYLLWLGIG
ncbi:LysE family transporter, partial [Caulobacter sp. HMWF025]